MSDGLAERTRRRLLGWLADDRPDPLLLVRRLREMRRVDEVPAFRAAVRLLAHLDLAEPVAEPLLERILAHRHCMAESLGRDPGLRVATVDFLYNVEQRMTSPMIVERSRLEETERSAVTDSLTGLYNRRFFDSTFEREIRRARRYGLVLSLIMLDLDAFKAVNDEFGHLFGDLVLRRVAKLVRRAVREFDTACRYGGEEFAVILPETDRLGAYAVAERIRTRVEAAFGERPTGGRGVAMTISGGVASYPDDGRDRISLVGRADDSLYRAKALGGNRVALHPSERRAAVRYPVRENARIELARAEGSPGTPTVPLNLSRLGALLETTGSWRRDEAVRVRLMVSEGRRRWVAPGHVVRVQSAARGSRIGIAFDHPIPDACLRAHALCASPLRQAAGGAP